MSKEVQRLKNLYEEGQKPSEIRIDEAQLNRFIDQAESSPRKRFLLLLHDGDWETNHRMINTILPESYVSPHFHPEKVQSELYMALKGEAAVLFFEENGELSDVKYIGEKYGEKVLEVRPGQYHTVAPFSPFVMLEVKGQTENYTPETDKTFAPWAPKEGTFVGELAQNVFVAVAREPERYGHLTKETLKRLSLADGVAHGLISAYKNHVELGESGKEKVETNQFGDTALRADYEAEIRTMEGIEEWAKRNTKKLLVRGEEIGQKSIGSPFTLNEALFATLDGLDGTANYAKTADFPYGTMVSIAEKQNPKYEDFVVSGIMLPEEAKIVIAIKDMGVYVHDIEFGKTEKLESFDQGEEYDDTKILSDTYFDEARQYIGEKADDWPRTGSTAATIAAIAGVKDAQFPRMNEGWQGLADVTRKGNLEQPIVYMITKELGGLMVDRDGNEIGEARFENWGQGSNNRLPVIIAKNRKVLKGIFQRVNF